MLTPTILLIPGSFALPEYYTEVFDAVRAKGYHIQGLHLPSVGLKTGYGREGSAPTMYDDAAFIAKEAENLINEGKDVILIGHSYGGVPVTQSTKGLGVKERQSQGRSRGIVNIAYMTCLVPAIGLSAADMLADVPQEHRTPFEIDENGWMLHKSPAVTGAIIMQDRPVEGEALVRKFPKHSASSFTDKLTHAGYLDIPVSYLLCEEDLCIPRRIQETEIEMIEKDSGNKVHVTRIKADHCPNLTATPQTVDWIVDVASRTQDTGY